MAKKLDAGDAFPRMVLQTVADGEVTLPDDIAASYQIVLFYRGHW